MPWRTFLVVLAALVAARTALPFAVAAYVDRQLDDIPDYEADLGDLDLNLWRGAYEIEHVQIFKASRGRDAKPFFEAARVDLSLDWRALLDGKVVNSTVLHRPILRFIQAEGDEGESQTGAGVSWRARLQSLFPLHVDRFQARDAQIHYETTIGGEPIDLYMSDFYLEMRNLTNIRSGENALPVQVEAAGRPFDTGEFEGTLQFEPLADERRFEINAELREIDLVDLNDVILAYSGADVEKGTLAIYTEIAVEGERFEGYVKTLLEDVTVFRLKEIQDPGDALEALWEGFVAVAAEVLENQPHDRLATRIPLEGEVGDVRTDTLEILANLLRNAFIQALRPALDHSVDADLLAGGGGSAEDAR